MKVCCISGECVSDELLECGITQGGAVFWLCKVPRVFVSQPFQKSKQAPWVGVKEQVEYLVGTVWVWGVVALETCHHSPLYL